MMKLNYCFLLCLLSICSFPPCHCEEATQEVKITVPGVTTKGEDYVCYSWKPTINKPQFITSFFVHPNTTKLHHFILSICRGNLEKSELEAPCLLDCFKIIYAWARNAPKLELPTGVGFRLDGSEEYLNLQLHYNGAVETPAYPSLHLTITTHPQPYSAFVGLMMATQMDFPPNTENILINASCQYRSDIDLHIIGFRTHSHDHGRVITGYLRRKDEWLLIGKGNPLWPQAFWPVQTPHLTIKKGDVVVARGVYSTKGEFNKVAIGSTHNDEMFNYYIMYYINSSYPEVYLMCFADNLPKISAKLPPEANELLPPNKTLDAMAAMHHHPHSHLPDSSLPPTNKDSTQILPLDNWPSQQDSNQLVHLSSSSTDQQGNVYVFSRGSHEWVADTFDFNANYLKSRDHPIAENTIFKLDSKTGTIVKRGGKNFFFMPHGIFIDSHNFIWTTDVALHQVFKFSQSILDGGEMKPLLTLGKRFENGKDAGHFCQPADVVVSSDGNIYVADGYCNQRIMIFDKNGVFKREINIEWESKSPPNFHLPHSVSLNEKDNTIYVADRPHKTIFMFNTTGTFFKKITLPQSNYHLFSLDYNPTTERLFCVDGNIMGLHSSQNSKVFVVNTHQDTIVSSWDIPHSSSPDSIPHSLSVSEKGDQVYVVLIGKKEAFLKFESTLENNNLGMGYGSYERHPLRTDLGLRGDANFVFPAVIFACLLLIPITIIIATMIYVKCRMKKKPKFYTPLRVDKMRDVDVGDKETDLLKRLNELSDDEEEDAFDSNLHLKPNGKA